MRTLHILLVFAIAIGIAHSQSCADKAPSEKCEEWKGKGACDKPIGEKACAKTCDKCDGGNDGTTSAPAPAPTEAPSDVINTLTYYALHLIWDGTYIMTFKLYSLFFCTLCTISALINLMLHQGWVHYIVK